MEKLKRLWSWLKKNFVWVVAGVAAIILLIFRLNSRKYVAKPNRVKQLEKDIVNTEKEIEFLKGYRVHLKEGFLDNQEKIDEIDQQLSTLDNTLKLRKLEIKKRTMEENLDRFKELGY